MSWNHYKSHKEESSTCDISRSWPADGRLSAKAKGLMIYVHTRRSKDIVTSEKLIEAMRDGRDAIQSGLRELRLLGYIRLDTIRGKKGRVLGTEWTFYETPQNFTQPLNSVKQPPRTGKSRSRSTENRKIPLSENPSLGESLFPFIQ